MTPEAPSRNPQTPQTEAGRAEHDIAWASNEWTAHTIHAYDREGCPGCALIAKIEAEAAQRVVERIREHSHLDDSGDPNKHEPKLCHAAFEDALRAATGDSAGEEEPFDAWRGTADEMRHDR